MLTSRVKSAGQHTEPESGKLKKRVTWVERQSSSSHSGSSNSSECEGRTSSNKSSSSVAYSSCSLSNWSSNSSSAKSGSIKSSHNSSSTADDAAAKKEVAANGSGREVTTPTLPAPPTKHKWPQHSAAWQGWWLCCMWLRFGIATTFPRWHCPSPPSPCLHLVHVSTWQPTCWQNLCTVCWF